MLQKTLFNAFPIVLALLDALFIVSSASLTYFVLFSPLLSRKTWLFEWRSATKKHAVLFRATWSVRCLVPRYERVVLDNLLASLIPSSRRATTRRLTTCEKKCFKMFRDEQRSDPNNWKFVLLQPPPGGKGLHFFDYFFTYIIESVREGATPYTGKLFII